MQPFNLVLGASVRYLRTFLFTAALFGLFLSFFELDSASALAVIILLLMSCLFGGSITLLVYLSDRRRLAAGKDISKDEVRPSESYVLQLPIDQVRILVVEALRALHRPKVEVQDSHNYVAITGMTWGSFGEVVSAEIKELNGDTTLLEVSSKPRLVTTIVDYGINSDNLAEIRKLFEKYIENPGST